MRTNHQGPGGTVRSWTARATPEGADAYVAFFRRTLVPQLSALQGHRGALVLTRADAGTVHITVLTFWDSMEAVRGFAVRHDAIALDTLR